MPTRKNLLDVAGQLFAELGWRGTTTRRIAERAGVNEVTLFRNFGSKGSLLLEAVKCQAEHTMHAQLPAEPTDPRSELIAWATVQHKHLGERSSLIRTCLAEFEEHPELTPVASRGSERTMADLLRYLRLARAKGLIGPTGSLEVATQMLMNSIFLNAITRDVLPGHGLIAPDKVIDAYVEHTLRALGNPPGAAL